MFVHASCGFGVAACALSLQRRTFTVIFISAWMVHTIVYLPALVSLRVKV